MPNLKLTPFAAAFTAAILMVLITIVLPLGFKTWFVHETGNIKILPAIGPILAIALLLRWPVRKIAIAFFVVGLLFSLVSLFRAEAPFQAGYTLLVVLHIFLLGILANSSLKRYLKHNGSTPLHYDRL